MIDDQRFIDEWDGVVREAGEAGGKSRDNREAAVARIVAAVVGGEARAEESVEEWARRRYNAVIPAERDKRRRTLQRDGEFLVDSLFVSGDDGATISPYLDRAYPIGTADGLDKALRWWTREDWEQSRAERYRNAGAAMAAAVSYDTDVAEPMIAAFNGTSSHYTGDLFSGAR